MVPIYCNHPLPLHRRFNLRQQPKMSKLRHTALLSSVAVVQDCVLRYVRCFLTPAIHGKSLHHLLVCWFLLRRNSPDGYIGNVKFKSFLYNRMSSITRALWATRPYPSFTTFPSASLYGEHCEQPNRIHPLRHFPCFSIWRALRVKYITLCSLAGEHCGQPRWASITTQKPPTQAPIFLSETIDGF